MTDITRERIIQVGMGPRVSETLLSAIDLGLFTEPAEAPADALRRCPVQGGELWT